MARSQSALVATPVRFAETVVALPPRRLSSTQTSKAAACEDCCGHQPLGPQATAIEDAPLAVRGAQYEITVTLAIRGEDLEEVVGRSLNDPRSVYVRVQRIGRASHT